MNVEDKKLEALKAAERKHREACQIQHCQGCGSGHCQGVKR